MTLFLGVDAGGAYTDAVVFDPDRAAVAGVAAGVIATAKAPTTHGALERGVAAALDAALARARAVGVAARPEDIRLVSISTTLATNALVEGQGAPAALVAIGLSREELARASLDTALGADPLALIAGGHDSAGAEAEPLDLARLVAEAERLAQRVSAFAVAAAFATRNPAHEIAARDAIRAATGLPVTCGHELTAKLGGPRRALTALLNARLVGLIDRLIGGVETLLAARGIVAPLMVVRGDGALMAAAVARERPIETILSGPAASLVGAAALTGLADALVADLGSTTTDIARLAAGAPRRDPEGARVGGLATLVDAVAARTFGLGGDSLVGFDPARGRLTLGPRRAVPLVALAAAHGELVAETLERQARGLRVEPETAMFVTATGWRDAGGGDAAERELMSRFGDAGPAALDRFAPDRAARGALERLMRRGVLRFAAFTPTDAAHVLELQATWLAAPAQAAADLLARRKDRFGRPIAPDGRSFSRLVRARLERLSAERLLEAAAAEDGFEDALLRGADQISLAETPVVAAALDAGGAWAPGRLFRASVTLGAPLVGLGAGAAVAYPATARMLGAELVVPPHADVANAVGAVAGVVEVRRERSVLLGDGGGYRVLIGGEPRPFASLEAATRAAEADLGAETRAAAVAAGADSPTLALTRQDRAAEVEGQEMIVERRLEAVARGRPRIAE